MTLILLSNLVLILAGYAIVLLVSEPIQHYYESQVEERLEALRELDLASKKEGSG